MHAPTNGTQKLVLAALHCTWMIRTVSLDRSPVRGNIFPVNHFALLFTKFICSWPHLGSGPYAGLYVVLNSNNSEFYCSSTYSYGFRVLIHRPHEQPRMTNSLLVPSGQETNIAIKPFELATRENTRYIAQKHRKCLYQSENPLKYHRFACICVFLYANAHFCLTLCTQLTFDRFCVHCSTYSSQNCVHECEMERLLDACNCSMYFFPQLDNQTRMCGKSDQECLWQVVRAFAMKPNATYSCRCQPSCWDLTYDTIMSMTPILRSAEVAEETGVENQELVILSIYFTKSYYRQYNRNPALSFTDFLCKPMKRSL